MPHQHASLGKLAPTSTKMNNAGVFGKYKDVLDDTNPTEELITVKVPILPCAANQRRDGSGLSKETEEDLSTGHMNPEYNPKHRAP